MFLLSKDPDLIKPTIRETRNALRIVFKVPSKITPKYEKSPFLIGTKLWDELPNDIQRANSVLKFKKEINKLYRTYKDLLNLNR